MTNKPTAGGRFRLAIHEEKAAADHRHAQRLRRPHGPAYRLPGDLFIGGGRRQLFLWPTRPWHDLAGRCAHRRARITNQVDTPLLVDIDTGWGGAFNIARTVKQMIAAGAAAVHLEDQVAQKRCGHRPNKEVVSKAEMVDRVKAAVDAKTDPDFVLMARTDALQIEGLQGVIDRACAFAEAGADAIFAEAMTDLSMYQEVCAAVPVPVLANLTEFGSTPYYALDELGAQGIAMVLYPLSPARAMQRAALNVMQAIRKEGTQKSVLDLMQPRSELYDYLGYHAYEDKLDQLFQQGK